MSSIEKFTRRASFSSFVYVIKSEKNKGHSSSIFLKIFKSIWNPHYCGMDPHYREEVLLQPKTLYYWVYIGRRRCFIYSQGGSVTASSSSITLTHSFTHTHSWEGEVGRQDTHKNPELDFRLWDLFRRAAEAFPPCRRPFSHTHVCAKCGRAKKEDGPVAA